MFTTTRALVLATLVALTGCGLAPQTLSTAHVSRAKATDYTGAYLALTFQPTAEIANAELQLRSTMGYVDLTHAIPPRDGQELHITVGYFQNLTGHDAEMLAEQFRNKNAPITINGYGVAKNQAAYFTLQGLDEARGTLTMDRVQFTADDPHVTFGINPANPHDVHGIPKPAQGQIGPFTVMAQYHLKQGTKNLW